MITAVLLLCPIFSASNELPNDPIIESVDRIEINTFLDEQDRPIFQQFIFYELSNIGYIAIDWRLKKCEPQISNRDGYVYMRFIDSSDGHRLIKSPYISYTFTHYDPELLNRKLWPIEKRPGLKKPYKKNYKRHSGKGFEKIYEAQP